MENGQLRIDTAGSVKIISFDNKALFGSQFNKGSNIQIATRMKECAIKRPLMTFGMQQTLLFDFVLSYLLPA